MTARELCYCAVAYPGYGFGAGWVSPDCAKCASGPCKLTDEQRASLEAQRPTDLVEAMQRRRLAAARPYICDNSPVLVPCSPEKRATCVFIQCIVRRKAETPLFVVRADSSAVAPRGIERKP